MYKHFPLLRKYIYIIAIKQNVCEEGMATSEAGTKSNRAAAAGGGMATSEAGTKSNRATEGNNATEAMLRVLRPMRLLRLVRALPPKCAPKKKVV